ncbi:BLUF domain-containing protein [Dyadobacter psychrotolerans]|uniref:BLUF domain-containing protein n=1 Tax=Dyadobacter psychrotolerans TaxID=2541721 RepID=A0A4R5DD64_9BACT|nr:BLUF domain-containing protein [Dyadobacter psychrotolerans]TDE09594.1 BLUF domain-containing protein [Dyadobacter psychrotolerans]
MEYCLIYLSTARELFDQDKISALLTHSHNKNRTLGITGILLYCNGSIIQVLEGEKQRVESLYQVISTDQRHHNLIRLYTGLIDQRTFPDWLMGYSTLTAKEFGHLHDMMPFIKNPILPGSDTDSVVISLLESFYKNNYRN